MQKHQLLHASNNFQGDLNKLQNDLEEQYGKVTVNLQDGTFKEIEEVAETTE